MVYIFGYLSLLSEKSVLSTMDSGAKMHDFVPCKLSGYKRTWNSHRDTKNEVYKRYVEVDTLEPVDRYSWSTLRKNENYNTNGICIKVDEKSLANMDAREVGYERVDITNQITPYDNFVLDNVSVYTYIAPEINCMPSKTHIDMTYVNMGILGAEKINKTVPGFLEDYVLSTEVCTSIVKELYQVFWSFDGRKLYLLNTHDSSVILLHSFVNYIYLVRKGDDPHDKQVITHDKQNLDYRNAVSGVSGRYSDALNSNDKKTLDNLFLKEDYWLDLFLLRNESVQKQEKLQIVKRGNWLTQIISVDILKENDRFKSNNDHWQENLKKV